MSDHDHELDALFARVRQDPPPDLVARILEAVERRPYVIRLGEAAGGALKPALVALAAAVLVSLGLALSAPDSSAATSDALSPLVASGSELDHEAWLLGVDGSQ